MRLRPPALSAAAAMTVLAVAGCSGGTATSGAAAPATSAAPSSTAASSAAPISPRISVSTAPLATDPAVDGYPLGEAVALAGGCTVAVVSANLDAAAEMATLVPGLTPTNGRFVLVTLAVQVTEGAEPIFSPAVLTADLRSADGFCSRCNGTADSPLGPDVPVVLPGQTVTWRECIDVTPEAAVPTSMIRVADPSSPADDAFAYWSLG